MPLVMMRDVVREPLDWMWQGRILFGKLTMLDGDGGLGKSTIMLDLAARLSRGHPLPDGTKHPPCGTLLLMAEDGAGDTILPRLENAGADMNMIGLVQTITDDEDGYERMPTIPDDLTQIENIIEAIDARFMVVDPILSYIGEGVNEYRDKEVRRAMMPIIAMAQRRGLALVCLRHVTKAIAGNAKHRGNASVAFTNLARSVLFAATDPDIPDSNILAQSKTNLGALTPSLRYRLVGCENGAARVTWEGVSAHTADSLNAQGGNAEERSELVDAEEFLRDALSGGPVLTTTVRKLARDAGVSEMTLRRAKASLRIKSKKARTQDGQWTWALPDEEPSDPDEPDEDTQNPVSPQMTPLSTFKAYREDAQGGQGAQGGQSVGDKQSRKGYPDVPIVMATGKYECVHCYKEQWMTKGTPQLCNRHRSALGLTGTEGD